MTKPHQGQFAHLVLPIGDLFAHQIGPRHPQMDATGGQFARDFTGGQQDQFDAFDPVHGARIFAVRSGAT